MIKQRKREELRFHINKRLGNILCCLNQLNAHCLLQQIKGERGRLVVAVGVISVCKMVGMGLEGWVKLDFLLTIKDEQI